MTANTSIVNVGGCGKTALEKIFQIVARKASHSDEPHLEREAIF
jgi:hypothetical protein